MKAVISTLSYRVYTTWEIFVMLRGMTNVKVTDEFNSACSLLLEVEGGT
jgi:hypothetical protein